MKHLFQIAISDHPKYKDAQGRAVKRIIGCDLTIKGSQEIILLECQVFYFDQEDSDITNDFAIKKVNLPATKNIPADLLDENGNPVMETVEVPTFDQETGEPILDAEGNPVTETITRVKQTNLYDRLVPFISLPVPISSLITQYIGFNLERFD